MGMGKRRQIQYEDPAFHKEMAEQSFKNTVDFKKIMDELEIEFCITGGLLLGLYREGKQLKNDEHDVDTKIREKDAEKFFANLSRFKEVGFNPLCVMKHKDGSAYTVALKRNQAVISVKVLCLSDYSDTVYIVMSENRIAVDGRRQSTDPPSYRTMVFSSKIFDGGWSTVQWKPGLILNCPNDIEGYLVERYGENWKTPIVKYEGWGDYTTPGLNPCMELNWIEKKHAAKKRNL